MLLLDALLLGGARDGQPHDLIEALPLEIARCGGRIGGGGWGGLSHGILLAVVFNLLKNLVHLVQRRHAPAHVLLNLEQVRFLKLLALRIRPERL